MASELAIRTAIVDALRKQGAYVLVTTGVSVGGVPDLLVCYEGRFIGLEVKLEPNRASPLQVVRMNEIIRAGGLAYVVYDVKEALSRVMIPG